MTSEGNALPGDPLGKLGHAEGHLRRLRQEIDRFISTKPYRLAVQADRQQLRDAKGTFAEFKFPIICTAVDPIPGSIVFVVGDFLTNTRAALDHLAWNLVLANGGEPDEYTAFPIRITPPRKRGSGDPDSLRVSGGVGSYALSMIEAAQPYSRADGMNLADHPLWILERLVGIDKHRHPVLCVQAIDSVFVGDQSLIEPGLPFRDKLEVGSRVTGLTLVGHSKFNIDIQLTTAVELEDGEPGAGEPLGDLCQALLDATRSVIDESWRPTASGPTESRSGGAMRDFRRAHPAEVFGGY